MNSLVPVSDPDVKFDFSDVDFDKSFPSKSTVILSTMCANVAVMGVPGLNAVRVVARGNHSTELDIQTSGSEMKISAPLDYGQSMNTGGNVFISGSGINTINGVLYMNGRAVDTSNPMMMLVMVPVGTSIKVGLVLGVKVVIRGVQGELEAKLQGVTNVEADYLTSADIHVSGTGSFKCQTIEGDSLTVKISGMGNSTVESGKVTTFQAQVSGMGGISFGGEAVNADLSVSGMGSINLFACTGQLKKKKSGMGNISVLKDMSAKSGKSSGFSDW
ncbi:hypothetical protein A3K29_03610 [Candidatus Collierbacteria bacterium RIFOXYB2_FULL_46_14]|uniref:Putative auto-transporter adhesin head GIN domain-containing protein n=1 Tax=Candidatus Collierbacteria bacterium GW2011_GWA2_46_26 TaxID=1618381 RepID=A0A0G1RUT4_9BACT|nr:MAG: hypothetical protein UW29_C0004G0228 [Candidatus Collierbacteria bacterium GW2011_GWC2_44_13]KKU33723.1 MAG: hypothetical protein UX47_C0001G0006 [Candidatus Collierbacteria bacterium GW2011_GWA2_46_26]OGD73204.1 MAG: hypothetical protein A3K29_03610 [Candidatus Collierbacteria bacterium RIFOXYB2_FULL_46_14]OGD76246.1 MAG: hypothetical protein A3K43_03610 [Candidatus Collierbacteria bacterium RIFOXYA2_FULL_46_20]OGD77582.1 MAG: hypothetical protein A3K39_03610 [Candidatus Collierbacteri